MPHVPSFTHEDWRLVGRSLLVRTAASRGVASGVVLPNSTDIDIGDGTITVELDCSKTEIGADVDEAIFEKP